MPVIVSATHTPGPWVVESTHDAKHDPEAGVPDGCKFWIADAGEGLGEVLALVLDTSGAEEDANARLFGAAPDMAQALREVDGDCYRLNLTTGRPECVFCYRHEGEPHDPDCTMEFVRAALAKVDGVA